ncbi:MAG: caspase family protein, partial [Methyloprofundus sp.]|nr:caspase family protein [Methyloprofundus sp.]
QWYEKSAAQNNTKAQLNLGFLYEKGLGVPKDLPQAMRWYEKASGLEKIDIPYAATFNSSIEQNSLRNEVKILKVALKNSRIETEQANKQLDLAQQQLFQQEISLEKSQRTLNGYKNQLTQAQLNNNTQEIARLNATISQKEAAITHQKQQLSKIETQYNKATLALNIKLKNTQKRTQQINTEILKNGNSELTQSKLLNTEALLVKTKARLLKLQQQSQQELQAIRTEKLQLDVQLNEKNSQTERALNASQQQLIQQQADKLKQEILLSQLQQKNNQYQQHIEKLNGDIKSSDTSKARSKTLTAELLDYKQAENTSRQQIKVMQERLKSTEQQLLTLKKNSDRALAAALADTANTSSIQQQKIKQQQNALKQAEQRIKEFESKWQKQQDLTQQVLQEKSQIKAKLKRLQESSNLTGTPGKLSIEIIDPPVALIRGTPTIALRSIIKQREIFGKVETADGLLSLLVNDNKIKTDKRGLFQTNVKLTQNETPVSIIAIDKSGQRASLDFILSLNQAKAAAPASPAKTAIGNSRNKKPLWETLDFGNYHALIIGNNHYKKIPSLNTPINDAKAVAQVLKEKYAFDSTLVLLDATRYEILSALNNLRASLTNEDNLLIYYAGHGELDQKNMRGHWLPVDADSDNTANWISTVAITDILNAMNTKHVLVVSDSCYSGAMTRSSLARIDAGTSSSKKQEWLKAMLKARSRTVLTSGGLKPVMDGGGGDHSVFAKAFIETLQNNMSLLEGQALYREVSGSIIATASKYGIEQVPEYAPIHHAGHESGEFFLIPKR